MAVHHARSRWKGLSERKRLYRGPPARAPGIRAPIGSALPRHGAFEDFGHKTKITFRQLFELPEDYRRVKVFAVPSNEENMDKLEAELARIGLSPEPQPA
jgi:hypothetical protein